VVTLLALRTAVGSLVGSTAVVVCAALATAPPAGAVADFPYPDPQPLTGQTQVHDPLTLIRPTGPRYGVWSTGPGIQYRISTDGKDYTIDPAGDKAFPLDGSQPWWWPYYTDPGAPNRVAAPDVSYHDGKYWMYYAASRWPTAENPHPPAAIGLATSTDGQPGNWQDQLTAVSQSAVTTFKAIDPNLIVTPAPNSKWYLTYGSAGISQVEVSPVTGKPSPSAPTRQLAEHPGPPDSGGTEAPYLYYHGGYYYLFTAWGTCCTTTATYNIRVGRSSAPIGPFTDRSGVALMNGGGTLVLEGHGDRVQGAGQVSVFHETSDNQDRLSYHYYDKTDTTWPNSYLGINVLNWTADGWPYLMHDYGPTLPTPYRIFSEDYLQSSNDDFRLIVQQDCNLVERRLSDSHVVWSSGTFGYGGNCRLVMQSNGVLALFDDGGVQRWHAQTNGVTANENRLVVQNDGNFVVYTKDNQIVCSRTSTVKPCDPSP
jgi:arabinan endo-1,5-alpha-L-arabinosidase